MRSVTEEPLSSSLPGSARWMLHSLEPEVRQVAERITRQLLTELPELRESPDPQLGRQVFTATHGAMRYFIDTSLGGDTSASALKSQFQKLGYREAVIGGHREIIHHAVQIATDELRNELRVRAADNELSASALNSLNEAINDFIAYLAAQIDTGYRSGTDERDQDSDVARARLLGRLLNGAGRDEIATQASIAGWDIPDQVSVLVIQSQASGPVSSAALDQVALTRDDVDSQVVVCPTTHLDLVIEQIRDNAPQTRIANCWPVPPSDVPEARKWVDRALALVEAKVIPARPVIDCLQHRTEIWLHAEPTLRRQLAQELLQALFDETENSREILTETLLVWLETRDSAPAIAAKLGVHPQTVRYRWKRINELFGDDLHDPDFVIQLTLVLKASVPLWLAGDQSDFQRYKEWQAR